MITPPAPPGWPGDPIQATRSHGARPAGQV